MDTKTVRIAVVLSTFCLLTASAQPPEGKQTVPFESLKHTITARAFQVDFPAADSNYHCLTAASDGKIYFAMNTHNTDFSCRLYRFDPTSENMTLLAKLGEVLGENPLKQMPEGKIHTPLFEYEGKLWFGTHTSFYEDGLPGIDPKGKITYQGGHFMNYDLKTGEFQDLAKIFPNEGIITMNMDRENEILYGLTWPSGLLISYDIKKKDLRYWGATQGRGEWGQHPSEWNRICRSLALDPEGILYGSTMDGRIWKYDRSKLRGLSYIEGLSLSHLPFAQSAGATLKGDFQHNWRAIEWNPNTRSFWGIDWECATLFEFNPARKYLRAVAELGHEAYHGLPRNPEIAQLGFMIGPKNTIFYLAHGPAVEMKNRPKIQSGLYLITYNIDSGEYVDHGPIFTQDNCRVFFSESIAIGRDDHIYSVAWVEVTDPNRIHILQTARKGEAPAETKEMVYEMQLIQLPRWEAFVSR